jgi:hypothetical protein
MVCLLLFFFWYSVTSKSVTSKIKRYLDVTLHAVGPSNYDQDKREYSYIEFKDSKGNIIPVSKRIRVETNMGVNFNVGDTGDFYFAPQFGFYRLLASNVGGEKRVVEDVTLNMLELLFVRIFAFPFGYASINVFVYMISLGTLLLIPIAQTIVDVYQGMGLKRELRALGFHWDFK